jgi:6-phosphogluconolactonase
MQFPSIRWSVLLACVFSLMGLLSCGSGYSVHGGPTQGAEVLYAAFVTPNGGGAGGTIVPMDINTTSGALTAMTPVVGPGNAVAIVVDSSRTSLYSSDFNTGMLYAYSIDPASGKLTPVSGSPYSAPFFGNGGPLTIDPSGKFVFYVPDPNGDIVTFLRNSSNGTLMLSSATVVQDVNQPMDLVVDPSGKFLYAADHSDPSGNEISVFSIDATTGGLTPVAGSPFSFQANSEPWGIALSSTGQYLYTALWNSSSVAALSVNTSTGVVTPITTSPFSTPALPQQLILHPSGKFLYTGSLSRVSAFSVNTATGDLSPINFPYTSVGPVALAADPSGKFLFSSVTFPTNKIEVWQIDPTTGALSPATTSPTPNGIYPPTAMAVITLP